MTGEKKDSPWRCKYWSTASICVLMAGIALRLIYINAPLASDELAMTSLWAQIPFSKIPTNYQYPNNHIFLTIIMSAILKTFGVNHFLLRLPVLLSGIFSLIIGYKTTLKITNNKTISLGVLFLLSVNPEHIYYSTNARGYILIMLFAQLIFYCFASLLKDSTEQPLSPQKKITWNKYSFFIGILCFLGTWTIPTFIFFEISLLVFLFLVLFFNFREQLLNIYFPYTQIILILLVSLAGFYFQYFILISKEMLLAGLSEAASYELSRLIPGILDQWVYPSNFLRYLFLLFATIGFFSFPKKKMFLSLLLLSIIFLPLCIIYISSFTGFYSKIPPPRVFIYIQPFFLIYASLGVYFIIELVCKSINSWRPSFSFSNCTINTFFCLLLFIPSIFYSEIELEKKYMERINREPYTDVLKFIKGLSPYDLILTSKNTHVWFYLYGANEMRKRVNNIIDRGELGAIYILEYIAKGESDIKRINKNGTDYFELTNYSYLYPGDGSPDELAIPAEMFIPITFSDHFNFFKINPKYIQKVYELKNPKDLNHWERQKKYKMSLEILNVNTESQIALRFSDSFFIYSNDMNQPEKNIFSLNINLLSVHSSSENPVFYLNGTISKNKLVFSDSWSGNAWTMDHPYGNIIFNRTWRPAIFLSKPDRPFDIILAQLEKTNYLNYIRGIQSYRISMSLP